MKSSISTFSLSQDNKSEQYFPDRSSATQGVLDALDDPAVQAKIKRVVEPPWYQRAFSTALLVARVVGEFLPFRP